LGDQEGQGTIEHKFDGVPGSHDRKDRINERGSIIRRSGGTNGPVTVIGYMWSERKRKGGGGGGLCGGCGGLGGVVCCGGGGGLDYPKTKKRLRRKKNDEAGNSRPKTRLLA